MPWPIQNVNTIRQEFVTKALLQGVSFSGLCREYGISRKTGYKWRQRALDDGLCRLGEHSRRPQSSPCQLDETTTCMLIRFKLRHPHWGPKKIRQLYARQFQPVPSLSSCQRVLTRAGLVLARQRRPKPAPERITIGAVAHAPNEVWTVDFKGWWRVASGQRCDPLSVRDAFSRYLLAVRSVPKADTTNLRVIFEQLFERHGLPLVIKSDNGAPFATATAPLGLSRLSAWWVALGIELDRSRPAHPQDNGAHERMHRDIAVELARCVQSDLSAQQAAFDQWREEFNWERPHEALGGRSPGEVYRNSPRPWSLGPRTITYGPGFFPRQVSSAGALRWDRQQIFISGALAGWPVGLRHQDLDHLEVWFRHLLLGHLEVSSARFLRAPSRPPEARTLIA
jgi:transposase InsO family protein